MHGLLVVCVQPRTSLKHCLLNSFFEFSFSMFVPSLSWYNDHFYTLKKWGETPSIVLPQHREAHPDRTGGIHTWSGELDLKVGVAVAPLQVRVAQQHRVACGNHLFFQACPYIYPKPVWVIDRY
jgi:hypothetical protein